jgi:hypothetical protein
MPAGPAMVWEIRRFRITEKIPESFKPFSAVVIDGEILIIARWLRAAG